MLRTALLCLALAAAPATAETVDGRRITIIDGDTVALPAPSPGAPQERVRLLDVDTPETWQSRCEDELAVGLIAKQRLRELLAGPVTVERHGHDRYRRTLARLYAGGREVGAVLLSEELAVRWRPGRDAWEQRLAHWCPRGAR
ncbi:thermonuclease family protein [Chelatococcus reniformis]|uniref:TNase-like domain-containing protein n=1 Tax=Chelatococcus reniformis TaxID=1494448 RepID=A0A916XGM3_9HYPH|nr:thermonuclease family protein [Chelatococcus reniformis]GGC70416.1 hypothetical protein GCM10010994_31180 [Chelatococcus reniformis]